MTRARRELVHPDTTPYYHCICRCVRRTFLCGQDAFSGKSHEHRKHWVLERLRALQSVYAVDICAYAVMSNHYHLVVRLDPELARGWSDEEVMERWNRLFSLPVLVTRYRAGKTSSAAERAGQGHDRRMARTPRRSVLVHAKPQRIPGAARQQGRRLQGPRLMDLNGTSAGDHLNRITFSTTDYLQLVDWGGRAIREDKRGAIPGHLPPILTRLGLNPGQYLRLVRRGGRSHHVAALGHVERLREAAARLGRRFLKGMDQSRRLYQVHG